ncbi:RAD55 family ATPase [Evansella cellulosilytica]|nr:ATPase domain-containing protein [Evansella cellulosilytica]
MVILTLNKMLKVGGCMKQLVTTGINGLDSLLNGGIPKGNGIIVEGAPGTGKTTMGIQFLYHGALNGENGLYLSFQEFPDQIYSDMSNFGFNIKELEKQKLLKIVLLSPEVLLEEMFIPSGLFEELVEEYGCKRIVIDSLSIFKHLEEDVHKLRKLIYSFKNILGKYRLTSLIISERYTNNQELPFEHFIFDGLIQLNYREKFDEYKERTLEILKMRGTKIEEGEHTYRLTDEGVYILPSYRTLHIQRSISQHISTGNKVIDENLDGGLQQGLIYLIETDSTSMYKYIVSSFVSQLMKKSQNFTYLLPSMITIPEIKALLEQFGINLEKYLFEHKSVFIEQFERTPPTFLNGYVHSVSHLNNTDYRSFVLNDLGKLVRENSKTDWFTIYNINSVIDKRGKSFVLDLYPELVALQKELNMSAFVVANIDKLDNDVIALLQHKANAIIKTWRNNKYQYLQVMKSQSGIFSQPYIVESVDAPPFFRLI